MEIHSSRFYCSVILPEVFVEKELKDALCRLNPAITADPDKAEEVVHKLRAILITVNNVGLVEQTIQPNGFAMKFRCPLAKTINMLPFV